MVYEPDQLIINIVGDKVALGPLRRELVPLYQRSINDFAVIETLGGAGLRPMTAEGEIAWYERIVKSETDVSFTIYELKMLRPIGNVALHQIDHFNRTATSASSSARRTCGAKGTAPRRRGCCCTMRSQVWDCTT